ncbi:hypothetical protein KC19_3G251600 [Ceratodon purpureus]|uniref:Uncharacterized protein n=1 Tax=Ceratodon purpureus TaxID=3225 RepID=A0A8T0IPA2_CERPU|nr:hypothetical protein KC19_3G251600 [Ceratodon purpureus]
MAAVFLFNASESPTSLVRIPVTVSVNAFFQSCILTTNEVLRHAGRRKNRASSASRRSNIGKWTVRCLEILFVFIAWRSKRHFVALVELIFLSTLHVFLRDLLTGQRATLP